MQLLLEGKFFPLAPLKMEAASLVLIKPQALSQGMGFHGEKEVTGASHI